ncbi:putative nucleotidyltransferase [Anaerosolibacter carboniphilus]|uniref:tRNA(Met) cytidine acetate ligase n=1 Tax=Anaerosolibacter carboniphilus TaxID=1417629 RepID=A0A841L0U9_9FIRM|nr:nucleotidyltransferase [Anaerosolibacter carboniphilus]MBB6217820.1 putative nucleotidyltransferase [Anaerosolibacter carboniphilus]
MKILGLITEYNPFHNGHKYHLDEAKKITGATHTIAVMSGNFLQRGEPAITDKWHRAEMAVREGVDLILELPFVYACNTAELFAYGAVSMLHHLNAVNFLCFGSEEGAIEKLMQVSEILHVEPESYRHTLKAYLAEGLPYPQARSNALSQYFEDNALSSALQSPNNILGIEYIKALLKLRSPIQPFTLKRIKADYHSTEIRSEICSATAIREHLSIDPRDVNTLSKVMPNGSLNTLENCFNLGFGPVFYSNFDQLVLYRLRTMPTDVIANIPDVTEGLENRFKEISMKATSHAEVLNATKSKRYTMTRLQRILIHALMDLQKQHLALFNQAQGSQYARVLAFSKNGSSLIRHLKKYSNIPILTNINREPLEAEVAKQMLAFDIKATNIYSIAYPNPANRKGGWDYYKKPFFLHNDLNS